MAFSDVLQGSLNSFREAHNDHVIRKQRNVDLPTGQSPNTMWQHPELFNTGSDLQRLYKGSIIAGVRFNIVFCLQLLYTRTQYLSFLTAY